MSYDQSRIKAIGDKAEAKVMESLGKMPPPWQAFHTIEWRELGKFYEHEGEADGIVFHPDYGVFIIEVKAGDVYIKDGVWHYENRTPMKKDPFSQSRKSMQYLRKRLSKRFGEDAVNKLTITSGAWFPDLPNKSGLPLVSVPTANFIFDRTNLANPEPQLLRMFRESAGSTAPSPWSREQQRFLKELLAPDCHLLMPMAYKLDDTIQELHRATEQQITALRLLRSQKRLLVEGGAGSGKTLLAATLARDHAMQGKTVLFTCFNKALALQMAEQLAEYPSIRVLHFHELVRHTAGEAGLPYVVPAGEEAKARFFQEECAELLLSAAEQGAKKFDTIIVDEAADFMPDWWVALESLGAPDFSWYCFFDRHQSIYQEWAPPFAAEPMPLDINLRNTKPVGVLATQLGKCPAPLGFRVETGLAPEVTVCRDFSEMAEALRRLLKKLTGPEGIAPERIVVLAPYRHNNPRSSWAAGLDGVTLNPELSQTVPGQVRVGTVQGFKGLEADVVILAGLNAQTLTHPELLYVGASRARAALYAFSLVPLL